MQLELDLAQSAVPGRGQALDLPESERTRPAHVMGLVEGPQLALGGTGLGREAVGRRLGAADRGVREGQAAQQVIPVAVGDEQTREREAGLLEQRWQHLELVGVDR